MATSCDRLLPRLGSGVEDVTPAVFVIGPLAAVETVAVIVMVMVEPMGIVPIVQVTTLLTASAQAPCVLDAPEAVISAGI